jgi:hypothetical protein
MRIEIKFYRHVAEGARGDMRTLWPENGGQRLAETPAGGRKSNENR